MPVLGSVRLSLGKVPRRNRAPKEFEIGKKGKIRGVRERYG